MPPPSLPALLLSRAAFGARPGDVERAEAMGAEAWIAEQLDWRAIDDSAVEAALSALPSLAMSPAEMATAYATREFDIVAELRLATIYRMAFGRRLLHEVMVELWSDHFSIHHLTNFCRILKTVDDRDVVRPHALGRFPDLLAASAHSAAMLHYLDNDVSRRGNINENYAREIMELHTLGVASGGVPYSEEDVENVALCFTGWTWDRRVDVPSFGQFLYRDADHDQGPKFVLGQRLATGLRQGDGDEVIRILASHPATARFVATRLVRRFVTDDPVGRTPDLVGRVAQVYADTGGDIAAMVGAILRSPEFAGSFAGHGGRLSRPLDLLARMLRAVDAPPAAVPLGSVRSNPPFARMNTALSGMGHLPFMWLTPDGYPDTKEPWSASSTTLGRWNLGLAVAGAGAGRLGRSLLDGFVPDQQTPATVTTVGAFVDYWVDRLLHRPLTDEDRSAVVAYVSGAGADEPLASVPASRRAAALALLLDSPYFQWR